MSFHNKFVFFLAVAAHLLLAIGARAQEAGAVAVGNNHACALLQDGAVYCWGDEMATGQRGSKNKAIRIPHLPAATSIDSGNFGSCAVDKQSGLWCWGADLQATIKREIEGDDRGVVWVSQPVKVRDLPPVRAVSVGFVHTCAISLTDEVFCWGFNPSGELGIGSTEPSAKPQKVGGIDSIKSISTGVNNTCAVQANGNVWCWGQSNQVQLRARSLFKSNMPKRIRLFEGATKISVGRDQVCALFENGRVQCWGILYDFGVGPDGRVVLNKMTDLTDVDVGLFFLCLQRSSGEVVCSGFEAQRKLLKGVPYLMDAKQISSGMGFGCAVRRNGAVVCWGEGWAGKVDGKFRLSPSAIPVRGLPLQPVVTKQSSAGAEPVRESNVVQRLRLSAEQGNADAQIKLARRLQRGMGTPQDYEQAAKWYLKAARQGNVDAQLELARKYDRGIGLTQDHAQAADWYRKVAERGNAVAQYNIGQMYLEGRGVPQDDTKALQWYRKAAEQGHSDAQYELCIMFAYGSGARKDLVRAKMWAIIAAAQENLECENLISGKLSENQSAEAKQLAKEWLAKHPQ